MKGILADINLQGQVRGLVAWVEVSTEWGSVWSALDLRLYTFQDFALPTNAFDEVVWRTCQEHELLLITANRKDEGPSSLEAAIQRLGTSSSLPVLTVGDMEHFARRRSYAERVAKRLMEIIFDVDLYRGTGRLYLP